MRLGQCVFVMGQTFAHAHKRTVLEIFICTVKLYHRLTDKEVFYENERVTRQKLSSNCFLS